MDLNTYLTKHNISGAAFAERLGISGASVSRIRKGEQVPAPEVMRAIILATGGKVTLEALVFPKRDAA